MTFINTGLDDLIVKSVKVKTKKEVYVPPGNGHKGYVKEVTVNADESKQPKVNPKAKVKPKYKKKPIQDTQPNSDEKQPVNSTQNTPETKPPKAAEPATWNPFRDSSHQKAYKREFGHAIKPTTAAKEYCTENLKQPLLGLEVINFDGEKVTIKDFSEPHFTDRFNLRFPEFIEQFIDGYTAEKFKDNGIDVGSPDLSDEDKREFDLEKNRYISTQTKGLSNALCRYIINAVKNPLFTAKGNSERTGGSTVYANRNAAVVVGNNGEVVTFWLQPIGKRFAIDNGWRGSPPPLSKFLRDFKSDRPESTYDWDMILEHDDENPRFFLKEEFERIYDKSRRNSK